MQVRYSEAHTIRIPIPVGVDTKALQPMIKAAGGCTMIPGDGMWYGPDGARCDEPVIVFHMSFDQWMTPTKIRSALKSAMQDMLDRNQTEHEFLVLWDSSTRSVKLTYRRD